MFELLRSSLFQAAVGAIIIGYVLRFLAKGYHIRKTRRTLVSLLATLQTEADPLAARATDIMAMGRLEDHGRDRNEFA